MDAVPDQLKPATIDLLLAAADDVLMLGHRNSDWTGLGPMLEEDIAFSAFAQDDMAHAKVLYELAGELDGRTADQLAFGRKPENYRCAVIVEGADEFDWATAIGREFICNHYNFLRFNRMARSDWKKLADLASRLAAEQQIALEHVDDWVIRLGAGTDESKQRMQKALDALGPLASSLHEPVEGQDDLVKAGVYPNGENDMFEKWTSHLHDVAERAGLSLNITPFDSNTPGGRHGCHSNALTELLDEMCEVYRLEPDAEW